MRGFKFTGVKLICLYLLCFVVFKNRADAITHLCVKIYIHFLNRCAGKDFLLCTPASIIVEMWYLKQKTQNGQTKLWRLNKWQHLHFYDNFYSLLFLRLSTFHLNATTGFFSSQRLVVLQTWGRQLGASPAKINDYLEKFDVHILFLADTGDQSA